MRILHVAPSFYPAWAYGGIPRCAYELCRSLVGLGESVTVWTTDAYDAAQRMRDVETTVDGIFVRRFRNLHNGLAYHRQLYELPETSVLALLRRTAVAVRRVVLESELPDLKRIGEQPEQQLARIPLPNEVQKLAQARILRNRWFRRHTARGRWIRTLGLVPACS